MKDLVDPKDLENLSDEGLDALEEVVEKERRNLEQARSKLDEALDHIKNERERRQKLKP